MAKAPAVNSPANVKPVAGKAADVKSKPSRDAAPRDPQADVRQREMRGEWAGLVLLGAGVAFACSLVSHDPRDMAQIAAGQGAERVANWLGPVGARMADLLLHFLGLGAFLLDALVLTLAVATLTGKVRPPKARVAVGLLGGSLSLLVLLHLVAQRLQWRPMGKDAAGLLPGGVAVVLKAMLSTTGTALLATMGLLASAAAITNRNLTSTMMRWFTGRAAPVVESAAKGASDVAVSGLSTLREKVSAVQLRSSASETEADETGPFEPPPRSPAGQSYQAGAGAVAPQPEPEISFTVAQLNQAGSLDSVSGVVEPLPQMPDTLVGRGTMPLPRTLEPAQTGAAEAVHVGPVIHHVQPSNPGAQPVSTAEVHAVLQPPAEAAPAKKLDAGSTMRMNRVELDQTLAELNSLESGELPELGTAFVMPVVDDRSELAQQAAPMAAPQVVVAAPELLPAPRQVVEIPMPVLPLHGESDMLAAAGPRIVETEALRNPAPAAPIEAVQQHLAIEGHAWVLPPSTLLATPPARGLTLDDEAQRILRENAVTLESKLAEFGILGEVSDIRPGPVVTTYEYRPAAGVKISKIVNLRDDLTMKLAALRVRVVAPIPGRDVVGIEVPNKERQIVYFREVLERPELRDSKGSLTMILGKDIEGKPMLMDLAKAPHLLVAGATGTGKSVGINSFICSLLFRCSPSDVKFIMIDPKILELSIYADIPHLLLPVLDEPRKAELALKWACVEMDRRYRLMADINVRNLASYKAKVPELRAAATRARALAGDHANDIPMPEDPPYIVVIIDEFADLIMSSGKEVEVPVARLAQKARAAGIHVVLATQRPSTDVITGMIKANFPTRVSFQVASAIDSKVVLNSYGAETLLGRGDMLLVPPGEGNLKRCHGTWISDDEVAAVAKHWRDQGTPKYEMDILKDPEAEAAASADDGESDPLYDDGVQVVVEAGQASVSFLQRKLGIGYGRAARMIDTMAARGIVGPSRGPNKPREILINSF